MPTVRVFEELKIWQMARRQCQEVFALMEDGRFDLDAPLRDQINRSSGSVMDNIAEGFDRFSRADFRHFLIVARGSNAEVRSQLHRAADRLYISDDEQRPLIDAARLLGVCINSLILHLDQSSYKSKPSGTSSTVARKPGELYGDEPPSPAYHLPQEHLHPN